MIRNPADDGPFRALRAACAFEALPADGDWLRIVSGLAERPDFVWLDSSRAGPRQGRCSFAAAEPWVALTASGATTRIDVRRAIADEIAIGAQPAFGDPLDVARAWLPRVPPRPAPAPFVGGWVGALGYELGSGWEDIPVAGGTDAATPELALLGFDAVVAHDHLEGRTTAFAIGVGESDAAAEAAAQERLAGFRASLRLGDALPPEAPRGARPWTPDLGLAAQHAKQVDTIRDRIAEGALYQACLTHRYEAPFQGSDLALHATLRARNPAPYAALLRLPGGTLVAASPERFLQVGADGWAEVRPIKGTRRRGADASEDDDARHALQHSEKDLAENLMIVDLVRNDLGRVCEIGSVHVPGLFEIESHPAVHQMVSTVRGRLRPELDAFDAVRAAFPPGSMTGAPKIAAMELLAALETTPRGFYAGAYGHFDVRGGCDLSVMIRSAVLHDGRASWHTGGGIVWDSEPAEEWDEARAKAEAVAHALADVEAGSR